MSCYNIRSGNTGINDPELLVQSRGRRDRTAQFCQPCSFPANLGLLFCGVAGFFEDLRVACFWAYLIELCLFFWACFLQISFCGLLLFKMLWHFCCFNLLLNVILECFCENLLILGLLFRMCLQVFHLIFVLIILFCWIFLPNACWASFAVKLLYWGLVFQIYLLVFAK